MRSADLIRMARQRAGLSQEQLAARAGHPRSTIARWESGTRRPTLESLEATVAAAGLDLVVGLARRDRSLAELTQDQLALSIPDRLYRLLPEELAENTLRALRWLTEVETPIILTGSVAAVLQGAPQRPRDGEVEVVARDPERLVKELAEAGAGEATSDEEARRVWLSPDRATVIMARDLPGADGYADLRRARREIEFDEAHLTVAHPRDLLRLAEASSRSEDRAFVPGLRALLNAHSPASGSTSSPSSSLSSSVPA